MEQDKLTYRRRDSSLTHRFLPATWATYEKQYLWIPCRQRLAEQVRVGDFSRSPEQMGPAPCSDVVSLRGLLLCASVASLFSDESTGSPRDLVHGPSTLRDAKSLVRATTILRKMASEQDHHTDQPKR